ncbi:MAG: ATPase, partial [Kiritimatiellae bacterium]|nr:ATPase [Kiritimatiellia bacterium]
SWPLAFAALDERIPAKGRVVILLDEISWMGGYDKDFPGYLKMAWDKRFKNHPNLILVLCGSVSAWIADNILNSTGFVGRNSLDVEVEELPLREAVQVMGPSADRMSTAEKFDILSVVGGVPRYLEEVRPSLTVDENVRRMCFLKQGLLFREFDETFNDVFGRRTARRRKVLEILSSGAMSAAEIAHCQGGRVNGHLTRTLRELEYAGFVSRDVGLNPETGKPARQERYRISDNYVRFYLHFIKPNESAISRGLFKFASIEQMQGWSSQLGFQFENLIVNNFRKLLPKLHLSGALITSAAPYRKVGRKGECCQIDLLLQAKRFVYVVEVKRQREIGREVIDEVEQKCKRLKLPSGVAVRTALVYDGHLAPSVEAEGYFDSIVEAKSLLRD